MFSKSFTRTVMTEQGERSARTAQERTSVLGHSTSDPIPSQTHSFVLSRNAVSQFSASIC